MPQPLVMVLLQIPLIRADCVSIPFVIDTGAALSCVHALDAVAKFGMSPGQLDPALWPSSTEVGGIGGQLNYLERAARFGFVHDDRTVEIIESTIHIGDMRSQMIPSLLGCDLLSRFVLTVNGGRSVTLSR